MGAAREGGEEREEREYVNRNRGRGRWRGPQGTGSEVQVAQGEGGEKVAVYRDQREGMVEDVTEKVDLPSRYTWHSPHPHTQYPRSSG